MSNEAKPRLLFLRFTQPNIPSFLQRHLQDHVRCLSQFFDVTVIGDSWCDYRQLCETHEPDVVMFESGSYVGKRNVINLSSYPSIPRIGFLSCDAYCPTRKKAIADMARWEISTFFGNSISLGSYTSSIADNLFAWPNFVDPQLFLDYGYPKVIPVLFTGSQAPNYPWRNKIDRIVSQRYPSLHSPHFGFQWQKGRPSATSFLEGEKYAQLINSAWVTPTCGTISNEVVRKHFEIPACNTCLLTQKTAALEAAGFVDLVNCVFADDDDVLDKLEWLFENPDKLNRITKAGKQLVDSQHTIRQRDQVFQWYMLHKKLTPGQKIVQPGPFLSLTVVDKHSGITNGHPDSCGVDRLLMKQGDEKLKLGDHDSAERDYRRCLNYQPDIPEAKLRLILCLLHRGDYKTALAGLREQFPSHRLVNEKEMEPDPTEWAWFLVTLLCCGKNREAAMRAGQFNWLENEELSRVRGVIRILTGRNKELNENVRSAEVRASVHQPLDVATDEWLETLVGVLRCCGQVDTANKLAILPSPSDPLNANEWKSVSKATQRSLRNTFLKYYLAAGSRLSRFAQRVWSRSQHLMNRIRADVPNGSSLIAGHDADVVRLLQKEEMRTGVLLGAAKDSWFTNVFLRGMRDNSNMPSAICVGRDSSAFRELHKQYVDDPTVKFRYAPGDGKSLLASHENPDVIAVDCGEVNQCELSPTSQAALVFLGHINNRAGNKCFCAMQADEDYVLVLHEPDRCDGYAVFRRIASKRPLLREAGITSVEHSASLIS